MGLVGLEWPLQGQKKLLLKQENLDSMLKSLTTSSPACILNLKMWILKMRVPQDKISEIFKSWISKWENGHRTNWPSPKKYTITLLREQPPLKSNIFWTPPKTHNSKIPTSPNLSRGTQWYIIKYINIYIYIYIVQILVQNFLNFKFFSCLIFWTQNVLIPLNPKIPQGKKCVSTPKLYTTHF